jgi:hypothetical protein
MRVVRFAALAISGDIGKFGLRMQYRGVNPEVPAAVTQGPRKVVEKLCRM